MSELLYKPPKKIKHNGYIYDVHTEHRNILSLIKEINDPNCSDMERAVILVTKIFGQGVNSNGDTQFMPVNDKSVNKALEILNNGVIPKNTNKPQEPFMDFFFDYKLYRLDILKHYNRDILDGIEWWELWGMVENLPKDSLLRETIDLRTMDTKGYDSKTKREIKEAQKQVAIPKQVHEETETEFIDIFENWK